MSIELNGNTFTTWVLESNIMYGMSYLISEKERLFGDRIISSNEEAIQILTDFYTVLKKVVVDYYVPHDDYSYPTMLYHLGSAKVFLIHKDYISAACEIFSEHINYRWVGAKDSIMRLLETELLNENIEPKQEPEKQLEGQVTFENIKEKTI